MSVVNQEFDRSKAFNAANRHSRRVILMRLMFPVCALAILFLYLDKPGITIAVNDGKGKIKIKDVSLSGKLLNPKYEGFDNRNGKYIVEADYALPNLRKPHLIKLHKIRANSESQNRGWIRLNAAVGLFNSKLENLNLTNGINIATSTGLKAKLSTANVNMKTRMIVSKQPVFVSMPSGTVNAGTMSFHSPTSVLNFQNDVRVHLKGQTRKTKANASQGMFQNSGEPIDVASRTLQINNKNQTALFKGQVSARQSDVALQANSLQIRYKRSGDQNPSTPTGNQKISRIVAQNNVVITTGNGQRATAESSVFDNDNQKVILSNQVKVQQGKNSLTGNKLVIDLKKRHSYFPPGGRVKGYFVPDRRPGKKKTVAKRQTPGDQSFAENLTNFSSNSNAPLYITANRLDIYDAKKYAVFRGNVDVKRDNNNIRSGYLKLDYVGSAPISGNPGGAGAATQIRKIIARNKVLITTPNNQNVTSDRATFFVTTDRVVVEGNVVLTQGDNVLKGNKLVINLKTGKYKFDTPVRAVFTPKKQLKVPSELRGN